MTTTIDFPALVKGIREARGLTQEQLAREIEVTFGTVNGWENGKHRPIQALASLLMRMARDAGVAPALMNPQPERTGPSSHPKTRKR